MNENADFPEAEGIVWNLESKDLVNFSVTTSANLLKDEDFPALEFEGEYEEASEI
jgi:hypothetical protein